MNDKQKTETILEALKRKCTSWHRCNVLFPELRLGSGYSDIAQRRIDLFMISAEKGNYTTAFEIKVSRADFLKDIKNNLKQRGARLYSSNFYYVAPKGMLKPDEIPMWAGLIEYDFDKKQFQKIIPAPLQNRNNPSWSLICSLVRRINESLYTTRNNTTPYTDVKQTNPANPAGGRGGMMKIAVIFVYLLVLLLGALFISCIMAVVPLSQIVGFVLGGLWGWSITQVFIKKIKDL